MADLAASDITVTQIGKSEIGKFSRSHVLDLAFGDGSLLYPAGGVPLSLAKLNLKDHVDSVEFADESNGDGYVYKWDKANNKIRIYTQGAVVGAAGAVAMDDFPVTPSQGTDAALSLSLTGTAGAGTHRWGDLKELATGAAVVATTLRAVVRGW